MIFLQVCAFAGIPQRTNRSNPQRFGKNSRATHVESPLLSL
jgi:hypothetical protein